MGWVFAYIGVIVVIVQGGLIGPLTRRFGEKRLLVAGTVIQGVALAALAEAMIYIQGDPTIHLAKYQSALQRVRAADNNFGGPVRVAVRPEAVV